MLLKTWIIHKSKYTTYISTNSLMTEDNLQWLALTSSVDGDAK